MQPADASTDNTSQVAADTRPGVLRNKASLTLQTTHAQRLVQGREGAGGKQPLIGLDGLARYAAQISNSAAAGDPYADLALLSVEGLLADTQKMIRNLIGEISDVLDSVPAVEVELAQSVVPVHVPLMFATPYGFLGAYLLADYDELVRTVMTARHCAFIDRNRAFGHLLRTGRPIRRLFCLGPTVWRYTGVTREDIAKNTKLAQQAKVVYANMNIHDIPADVLQGSRRGRYAPPIRQTPATSAASYLEEDGE